MYVLSKSCADKVRSCRLVVYSHAIQDKHSQLASYAWYASGTYVVYFAWLHSSQDASNVAY